MRRPPRPLRAVLFDWDGTIVDSAEASFRCYVRLFESYRIPFDRERFQRTYSPDWYRTYTTLGLPNKGSRTLTHEYSGRRLSAAMM